MIAVVAVLGVVALVAIAWGAYWWGIAKTRQLVIETLQSMHFREVTALEGRHQQELERLQNAIRHGTAVIPQAVELPRMVDAEERMAKRIDEVRVEAANAAVDRGFNDLKAAYQEAGLSFSDEEIREHAARMVRGEPAVEYEGFPK